MGALWNPEICESAKLISLTVNYVPNAVGSSIPDGVTKWYVIATAVFVGYNASGKVLGTAQSGGGRLPYFNIIDGALTEPTVTEINDAIFSARERLELWVSEQLVTLCGS